MGIIGDLKKHNIYKFGCNGNSSLQFNIPRKYKDLITTEYVDTYYLDKSKCIVIKNHDPKYDKLIDQNKNPDTVRQITVNKISSNKFSISIVKMEHFIGSFDYCKLFEYKGMMILFPIDIFECEYLDYIIEKYF